MTKTLKNLKDLFLGNEEPGKKEELYKLRENTYSLIGELKKMHIPESGDTIHTVFTELIKQNFILVDRVNSLNKIIKDLESRVGDLEMWS